jgi:hypothetical protein
MSLPEQNLCQLENKTVDTINGLTSVAGLEYM